MSLECSAYTRLLYCFVVCSTNTPRAATVRTNILSRIHLALSQVECRELSEIQQMRRRSALLLSVLLTGLVSCQQVFAQRKTQKPQQEQADDVVRVKTELVQTDITVVDKRGRFVDGLRADDFELLVGAGVVIYSLSTRPNFFGPGIDVSTNGYPDFSPRTASRGLAEDKMPQESLETLAEGPVVTRTLIPVRSMMDSSKH